MNEMLFQILRWRNHLAGPKVHENFKPLDILFSDFVDGAVERNSYAH